MGKFTAAEREIVKSIVATLSIKRIPDTEIIQEIKIKTGKSVSRMTLFNLKQRIEKESYKWYTELRDSRYAYLATFKDRIDSFFSYQKKLHEIMEENNPSNKNDPGIQIKAISELVHIETSVYNTYKDLAGLILNRDLDLTEPRPGPEPEPEKEKEEIVCFCEGSIMNHYECSSCHHVWCPEDKSIKQENCPECSWVPRIE